MTDRVPASTVAAVVYVGTLILLAFDVDILYLDLPHIRRKPQVLAWCAIFAAQVALWSVLLPILVQRLRVNWAVVSQRAVYFRWALAGLVMLFGTLMAGHGVDARTLPVHQHIGKINVISVLGLLVIAAAVVGLEMVAWRTTDLRKSAAPLLQRVDSYQDYMREIQWSLRATSAIVAAAMLSTGALQQALVALNSGYASSNAMLMTVLYGSFGSGVIALFYFPSVMRMREVGRELRAEIVGPIQAHAEEDKLGAATDYSERRESASRLLQLDRRSTELFQEGAAILAPLLASSVSLLTALR